MRDKWQPFILIFVFMFLAFLGLGVALETLNSLEIVGYKMDRGQVVVAATICFILAGVSLVGGFGWFFWQPLKQFVVSISKWRFRSPIYVPHEKNKDITTLFKLELDYKMEYERLLRQIEILQKEDGNNSIEFYRTRDEMIAKRGTLPTELQDMKKVWVSWWTAISPTSMRLFDSNTLKRQPAINRMILFHPYGRYIKCHSAIDARDEDVLINQIQASCREAKSVGVDVKLFDGFIEGMIIADPISNDENQFSDESWIRVETAIPYRNNKNCCNFVVYKFKDAVLFEALVDHYKLLWGNSITQVQGKSPNNPTDTIPESKKPTFTWFLPSVEWHTSFITITATLRADIVRPITIRSISLIIHNQEYLWNSSEAWEVDRSATCDGISFTLPLSVPRGNQSMVFKVNADGKEYYSQNLIVDIPEL